MSISIHKNNILLNNKIIFSRKYPNFNFPKNKDCKDDNDNSIQFDNKDNKEYKDIFNRLPPPLWCLNEIDGCQCGKFFRNPLKYKLHLENCCFDENNLIEEETKEKSAEDLFCELDDDTISLIESYERKTGNNIFMQFLLGQVNYNLIDNIKKEYYDDYEYENELINEEDNLIVEEY